MTNTLGNWLIKPRTESPDWISRFRDKVQRLSWEESDTSVALRELFEAVDELAQREVDYYHRRRNTRAWLSGLCRTAAWLFGSVGILIPLVAATEIAILKGLTPWGYVSLAAAASFLGANALFGGTTGHVRFVITQLKLEKLIAETRIRWCKLNAAPGSSKEPDKVLNRKFELVLDYATAIYSTTIAETGHWAETILDALRNYESHVDKQAKQRPKKAT